MAKPAVLLIGGLDPQGAAGITADIQTVTQCGGHPVPLITCLTEQTADGLKALNPLSENDFAGQLQCCTADFNIAAVKIGLLPNAKIAKIVADFLQNNALPAVLDPVLSASSGGQGVDHNVIDVINKQLLPHIALLTPNLPELQHLAGSLDKSAINKLLAKGVKACLLKDGHGNGYQSSDFYQDANEHFYLTTPRYDYPVRGTGCVLASAVATYLARQFVMREAVALARSYLNQGYLEAQTVGPYRLFQHQSLQLNKTVLPDINVTSESIAEAYKFPDCPKNLGIYPVVDTVTWLEKCFAEGIRTIQLRLKTEDKPFAQAEINKAVAIAANYPDSRLFINDHWQQAIDAGAYGVHLGQEDLYQADLNAIAKANLRLGISTHSYWELARALTINPSYIALGPVYATDSKQMPWQPQGHDNVIEWLQILGETPLVAIGGIDLPRAKSLKKTGVGSVAMISAIIRADDYRSVCRDLLALWPESDTAMSILKKAVQRISL
ncbi:MAG TPA: thiamine phosphate synthase [Methylophaga sp.]|nr:thiamine phosphate synthase [Methylophaga sp.]